MNFLTDSISKTNKLIYHEIIKNGRTSVASQLVTEAAVMTGAAQLIRDIYRGRGFDPLFGRGGPLKRAGSGMMEHHLVRSLLVIMIVTSWAGYRSFGGSVSVSARSLDSIVLCYLL